MTTPPPPPFWLNPLREWTDGLEQQQEHLTGGAFVLRCLDLCMALGCSVVQACGVVSNSVIETGWGRYHRGNNLGGVKATKAWATPDSWWWRAPGHVDGGDQPWCYYRVFPSFEDFFKFWLKTYVPKPGAAPKSRYKKTGEEFWNHHPWFDDLIAAGYKGEVTRANPGPSLRADDMINDKVEVYVAQRHLGVTVDGKWGPKSKAALQAFQRAHGLPVTDEPEPVDVWTMLHPGVPLPAVLRPARAPEVLRERVEHQAQTAGVLHEGVLGVNLVKADAGAGDKRSGKG